VSDPHWLVKDFHVLYRAAKRAHDLQLESFDRGVPDLLEAFEALRIQLARLRPAFETCEAERLSRLPQRLTPAERQALAALHRWLHSPVGDDMLIEEAQDYHDQVEAESAAECERLQTEEREAYDALMREDAAELVRRRET
jgi:hypothetical protein